MLSELIEMLRCAWLSNLIIVGLDQPGTDLYATTLERT